MEIEKIINEEGKCIYNIKGRIDTQTAPELQKAVDESFMAGENNLVFNFDEVEYLSSAGLRTILYTQKKINALQEETNDQGQNAEQYAGFEIINVKPEIMEVFDMTGFNNMVKITPVPI